jgi:hypothetical protein
VVPTERSQQRKETREMETQTTPAVPSIHHVNAVVTALVTAHPEAALRIARGADLVEAGAVEPTYGGVHLVYSQSEPDRAYALVQDRGRWLCDCLDATQRGQGCKHHWACVVYLACERLDAEANDPTLALDLFEEPVDVYGEPINYELTPKAYALLGGAA